MEIYVVQQGDTIYSISEKFGISVDKIMQDNGLFKPVNIIIGQVLVITYPKQSHTIQLGDTVQSIADLYNVSIMQILRNNPNLSDRQYNVGESLVISYNTKGSITTNGFAYPFIGKEILYKTLPNLTYLSIFNYTTIEEGEILTYGDDSDIIKISKDYGVIPLLMITTLGQHGEPNIDIGNIILQNEKYQENNINLFTYLMKSKGYQGLNIVFNNINEDNQSLYENFLKRIASRLQDEGLLLFITINYQTKIIDGKIKFEQVDYSKFSSYVNGIIFLKLLWGNFNVPPAPVSNINYIKSLIDYLIPYVTPDKIILGNPVIGYDWSLPYIPDKSYAYALSSIAVLDLAYNVNAIIQFDENSQTPYYYYSQNQFNFGNPFEHIVWFIDARSINALTNLIFEFGLNGNGVWNIMIYNASLWSVINSQFDIIKL